MIFSQLVYTKDQTTSLEPRLFVPDFVSQLWRKRPPLDKNEGAVLKLDVPMFHCCPTMLWERIATCTYNIHKQQSTDKGGQMSILGCEIIHSLIA